MFVHRVEDGLYLKLLDVQDAKRVFELVDRSRDYMREWLSWIDGTKTKSDSEEFIRYCRKEYAENKGLHTAIIYNDEIAGVAGFNSINWSNRTVYIGYWLGEGYQGKGIMTKVAKSLTRLAFDEMGFNKVEIRAAAENFKSRSIPERLGFVEEGCLRQAEWLYDHFVDHIVYGMLKEEWREKHRGRG